MSEAEREEGARAPGPGTPDGDEGHGTSEPPVAAASPSAPRSLQPLAERVAILTARLTEPPQESERAPLRDELVGLAREIDSALEALRGMRESLKPLAERYKHLYPRPAPAAPRVVDHLGASTYRERGWSALSTGAYEEAVRQFRSAIERDPSDPAALAMLAWSYLHLGRDVDATKVLERAMGAAKAHPLTRTIAGFAYLRAGRAEPAAGMLRTVAYGDPTADRTARMYAHLYLGVALSRTGQADEGRIEIRRALEIGPNLTEAWWELGRLHAAEGDLAAALDAWRTGAENGFSRWGERCRAEMDRATSEAPRDENGAAGESAAD